MANEPASKYALQRSFIRFPTQVEFGSGSLKGLGSLAARFGSRAYLIMDPFFKGSAQAQRLTDTLEKAGVGFNLSFGVRPNPRAEDIDERTAECVKAGCDMVIAVGGGSTIDIGKAAAMLATNGGRAWDYTVKELESYRLAEKPPLPMIAVPTTAGTGSEGTIYSVVTNPGVRRKCTIRSFYMYPAAAVIDPDIMKPLPPLVTALTGIDAFAHSYESYTNRNATMFSRMLAFEGMRLFAGNIEACCLDGQNGDARAAMAFSSLLGGMSIAHCPTTLAHVIGQCLSGWVDAPHGGSLSVCLIQVVRFALGADVPSHARIARLFDDSLYLKSDAEAAAALPDLLDGLFTRILPVRPTMRSYGFKAELAGEFSDFIYHNYRADIANFVRVPERNELDELIRECL